MARSGTPWLPRTDTAAKSDTHAACYLKADVHLRQPGQVQPGRCDPGSPIRDRHERAARQPEPHLRKLRLSRRGWSSWPFSLQSLLGSV